MFTKLPYGANFISHDQRLDETIAEKILFRYQRAGESNADVLERTFCRKFKVKHALATPNCTSALRLALLTTRPVIGERVAIPAVSFVATAGAVLSCGLIPHLVDVDDSLLMKLDEIPSDIERCVVVHLDGFGAMVPSRRIVIEDCAQSIGARRPDGSVVGSNVHAAAFSFQHNKLLSSGTGGIFATEHEVVHSNARSYHDHGSWRTQGKYPTWDERSAYGENLIGNELVAAIQLQQVRRFNTIRARLVKNYKVLRDEIAPLENVSVIERSTYGLPLTLRIEMPSQVSRERCRATFEKLGVPYWTYDRYFLPDNPVIANRRSIYADGFPWTLKNVAVQKVGKFQNTRRKLERTIAIQIPPQFSETAIRSLAQVASRAVWQACKRGKNRSFERESYQYAQPC